VVATVHETIVVDAMPNSEHVGNFMTHDGHRAILYLVVVCLVFFHLEEAFIVAGEGEDPGSVSDSG
jgi:hypothetical protein